MVRFLRASSAGGTASSGIPEREVAYDWSALIRQPLGVVLPSGSDHREVRPTFTLYPGEYGVELIRGEGLFRIESGQERFRIGVYGRCAVGFKERVVRRAAGIARPAGWDRGQGSGIVRCTSWLLIPRWERRREFARFEARGSGRSPCMSKDSGGFGFDSASSEERIQTGRRFR